MNLEQSKMKAELIEAVDIIAEREEALGQEPMEDIQEMMFINPVFSQQALPLKHRLPPMKWIFRLRSRF